MASITGLGLGQAAYSELCEVKDLLIDIREGQGQGDKERVRNRADGFVITADGSGNGDQRLYLPPGISWELRSFFFQTTGAIGYVAFYVDQEQGTNGLKVEAASTLVDGAFVDGHYIPEQSALLIVARGVAAGSQVSGRVVSRGFILGESQTVTDQDG